MFDNYNVIMICLIIIIYIILYYNVIMICLIIMKYHIIITYNIKYIIYLIIIKYNYNI
jgi:hypothetical protein